MAELSKSSLMQPSKQLRSRKAESEQNEFEMKFYSDVLERYPDYVDVLRVFGVFKMFSRTVLGHCPSGSSSTVHSQTCRPKPRYPA